VILISSIDHREANNM